LKRSFTHTKTLFVISQPLLTMAITGLLAFWVAQGHCFLIYLFFLPAIRLTARGFGTNVGLFWAAILLLYPLVGLMWDLLRSASSRRVKRIALVIAAICVVWLLGDLDIQWGRRVGLAPLHLRGWEVTGLNVGYGLLAIWLVLLALRDSFSKQARLRADLRPRLPGSGRTYRWTMALSIAACSVVNLNFFISDSGAHLALMDTAFLPVALVFYWTGIHNSPFLPSQLWLMVWVSCSVGLYAVIGLVIDRFSVTGRSKARSVVLAGLAAAYAFLVTCFHIWGPREGSHYWGPWFWAFGFAVTAQVGVIFGLVYLAWRGYRQAAASANEQISR